MLNDIFNFKYKIFDLAHEVKIFKFALKLPLIATNFLNLNINFLNKFLLTNYSHLISNSTFALFLLCQYFEVTYLCFVNLSAVDINRSDDCSITIQNRLPRITQAPTLASHEIDALTTFLKVNHDLGLLST